MQVGKTKLCTATLSLEALLVLSGRTEWPAKDRISSLSRVGTYVCLNEGPRPLRRKSNSILRNLRKEISKNGIIIYFPQIKGGVGTFVILVESRYLSKSLNMLKKQ